MRSYDPPCSPPLSELFPLDGKTALVIGGAGLLGSEISAALIELGAAVAVASRDQARCAEFATALSRRYAAGSARGWHIDVTEPQSVVDAITQVANWRQRIDILVNCSWSGKKNSFESISEPDWIADVDSTLNGVFRSAKAALPWLKESKGVILNIASMYGHVAPDYRLYLDDTHTNPPSYGAAKAGVIQLTRYMASFFSPYGIRVNCISPGPFPYPRTQEEDPEFAHRLGDKAPLKRVGNAYELKGAAALLCSDASSYITGQNICVDGGWTVW